LETDEADRDRRGCHHDRRFVAPTLAHHHHDAEEMQQEKNGHRSMRHLQVHGRCIDIGVRPARRDGRAGDSGTGKLRGRAPERHRDEGQRRGGARRSSRTRGPVLRECAGSAQCTGTNRRRGDQREQCHGDEPMCDGRPWRVPHFHGDAAKHRRREHRDPRTKRRAQHAAAASDAHIAAIPKRDEHHRADGDEEDRCEIAMTDFDDQIRAAERREPIAEALGPMISASHS
jgi:hypothetical protein